mmetsp:Transcript_24/g.66  ORF Transcript_24/g.66 Transcript_24/m.66 type:complete len:152 (+) Transcript_24:190-645(+)
MRLTPLLPFAFGLLSVPTQGEPSCEHVQCGDGIAAIKNKADCKWACETCRSNVADRDYYWIEERGIFDQCICGGDRILCSSDLTRSGSEVTIRCNDGAISSEMMPGCCPRNNSRIMNRKVKRACGRSGGSWSCSGSCDSGEETSGVFTVSI